MRVFCVIPAFNEEKYIYDVAKMAKEFVDVVVVVDDGSTDKTFSRAIDSGAVVLRHEENMGKGAALRTGFKYALEHGADVVVTLDGDMQHDPLEIPKFLEKIREERVDIVVGSRFLKKVKGMPIQRRLSNFITTKILNKVFKVPITDSQSGFRAFKRKVLEKVTFKDNKYGAETEILIEAKRKRFNIVEIPISVKYEGQQSKIRPIRETFSWIWLIIKKYFG
ncbi:MAG: glycosyltransferase family 2 protein [Candidatus Odinarchaeota archaeon]|nr:glycosyltransferase family 2 protein [Candidatus Odinarchaeota archaeon]